MALWHGRKMTWCPVSAPQLAPHGQHGCWVRLWRHGGGLLRPSAASEATAGTVTFLHASGVPRLTEMPQLWTCGAKGSRQGEHRS